jgi:malate dehydrogenase (oxaloacetate-decarboxylating)
MHLGGKLEITSKRPLKTRDDLSMAYTPGVARVAKAIKEDPSQVFKLTIKGNAVGIVTDGSAVLGLGNIGPEASLPVMEGKSMLFKEFAGVDAFPIALDTQDPKEIVEAVKRIAPVFGAINLEDISAPRCFQVEEQLRHELDIPVFHDDRHSDRGGCSLDHRNQSGWKAVGEAESSSQRGWGRWSRYHPAPGGHGYSERYRV